MPCATMQIANPARRHINVALRRLPPDSLGITYYVLVTASTGRVLRRYHPDTLTQGDIDAVWREARRTAALYDLNLAANLQRNPRTRGTRTPQRPIVRIITNEDFTATLAKVTEAWRWIRPAAMSPHNPWPDSVEKTFVTLTAILTDYDSLPS